MSISKIDQIKKHFVTEERLFLDKDVLKLPNKIADNTNCYDYVLGLLFSNTNGYNIPGFTTKKRFKNEGEMITRVCEDLENLGKNYRRLYLSDSLDIADDEYLVKLFYSRPSASFPNGYFHAIRQNRKTQIWYHKPDNNQPIVITSANSNKFVNPDQLVFTDPTSNLPCTYYAVCYLAIQEQN